VHAHLNRDTVCRKEQVRRAAPVFGHFGQGVSRSVGYGFDKAGMIVKSPDYVDWRGLWANFLAGTRDIFTILPAARVRAKGRRYKRQCTLDAVVGHLLHHIAEHRMPVAISPVNGQMWAVNVEFPNELAQQAADLAVQWADAAEMAVMLGNFQESIAGDIASAGHVIQKGNYVVRTLRAAKRDDEQGVVRQCFQWSVFSAQISVLKTGH